MIWRWNVSLPRTGDRRTGPEELEIIGRTKPEVPLLLVGDWQRVPSGQPLGPALSSLQAREWRRGNGKGAESDGLLADLTNAFKFQDKWKLSQLQMIFQWRTYNHKYSDSQMDFFGKCIPSPHENRFPCSELNLNAGKKLHKRWTICCE